MIPDGMTLQSFILNIVIALIGVALVGKIAWEIYKKWIK